MALPDFVKKLLVLNQMRWENGNFVLHGVDAVIFRADTLTVLREMMIEKIGLAKTKDILYELGREQAKKAVERYKKVDSPTRTFETVWADPTMQMARAFLSITGWGVWDQKYMKENNLILASIQNSPIAKHQIELYGKSKTPVCYYIAGLIGGGTEAILGKEVAVTEKSCSSQGISKDCIFEVKLKG